jgi:thioredoxin 1
MENITSENFKEKISQGTTVVDFWAEWCGPCKMLTPILEELDNEMNGISFYKVDADANSDLALELQITSIPTIIIYKNGEIIGRNQGAKPKVLMRKFIEDVINS